MVGQAIASIQPPPRRWVERFTGSLSIHRRQKWTTVWSFLSSLSQSDLQLLDAGCGDGVWALELASRRPAWNVTGIDQDPKQVARAIRYQRHLGLQNAFFREIDFLSFTPATPFDVVLSVESAHYLAEAGLGTELFRTFRRWLVPGGRLILLVPRCESETPFVSWLPRRPLRNVFVRSQLLELCSGSNLQVEHISPVFSRLAAVAKQISWMGDGGARALSSSLYPLQVTLSWLDQRTPLRNEAGSVSWFLVARAV